MYKLITKNFNLERTTDDARWKNAARNIDEYKLDVFVAFILTDPCIALK